MTPMKQFSAWPVVFLITAVAMLHGCEKKTPSEPDPSTTDIQLTPPPQGQGVQISVPPFTVLTGSEVQRDYYLTLPSDSDLYVNRIEFKYNPGSHHCNVFRTDSLKKTDGTFDETFMSLDYTKWDMFAASQKDSFTWQLPAGVAIYLKKRDQICIQTHYVNASTQQTPSSRGKVLINLWTIPQSQVTARAGLLFASNTRIILPPGTTDTVRKITRIPWAVQILGMTGHFHSRGRNFWAERQLGNQEVYRNVSWSEPQIKIFSPPLAIFANENITYYSDYVNTSKDTVWMGPHVENQEHSNLFVFYYPAAANGKTLYDIDQGW